MSDTAKWYDWVHLLRSWGYTVVETPGCYGANNGLDWDNGVGPQASLDHHFGCSLNPAQSYIDGMVNMLKDGYATGGGGFLPGPVVNRFVDMNGVIYLIATGPANHAGQGSSVVLNGAISGLAPSGSAASRGLEDDGIKNHNYVGTETQHPGDSTPYPEKLIDSLVALNAADCLTWGYSPNAVIQHFESTRRKVDMSYLGGVNGTPGPGVDIRAKVKEFINAKNNPSPAPEPVPVPPLEEDEAVYPTVSYASKIYAVTPWGLVYIENKTQYNTGVKVKLFKESVLLQPDEYTALVSFTSNIPAARFTAPLELRDAYYSWLGKTPDRKVVDLDDAVAMLFNYITIAVTNGKILRKELIKDEPEQTPNDTPPNG